MPDDDRPSPILQLIAAALLGVRVAKLWQRLG